MLWLLIRFPGPLSLIGAHGSASGSGNWIVPIEIEEGNLAHSIAVLFPCRRETSIESSSIKSDEAIFQLKSRNNVVRSANVIASK